MQINFIKSCLKLFVVLGLVLDLTSASAARRGEDACYDKGVSGECTLFKDFVQVQPMVADELIRISLNDRDIEFGEYTNRKMLGQDDVYEVTDSEGATHKFWFDDMQDSKAGNVQTSVSGAVCLLNNGEPEDFYTCGFNSTPNNNTINEQLRNFGMWAHCHGYYCYGEVTHLQGDLRGFVYKGQTIIKPDIFKTLQIASKSEVHEYLRDYTMLAIAAQGLIMTGFNCFNMPLPYKATKNNLFFRDDVMVCTVKYIDPETSEEDSQIIDFLFDDMYEYNEKTASAGRSALVCNAQGGSASQDGLCAGFNKDLCDSMNDKFGVDTEWLPEQGGCIMKEVSAEAKRKKNLKIAGAVGSIILGVVATPFSGGGTTLVVVAAIGTLMTVIATAVSANAAKDIDFAFKTTLLAANQCLIQGCGGIQVENNKTDDGGNTYNELWVVKQTSQQCLECAEASMEELVKATVMYDGEIADADINASAYLLDVFASVFYGRMMSICVAEIAENTEQSPLVAKKQKADTVALVGSLLTLGAGAANGVKNLPTLSKFFPKLTAKGSAAVTALGIKATQLVSKMQKMASTATSTVTKILKDTKYLSKLSGIAKKFVDNLSTADSIRSIVSGVDSIKSNFSGAAGIVAEYSKVCNTQFPCNETIFYFMDNLIDLCGG